MAAAEGDPGAAILHIGVAYSPGPGAVDEVTVELQSGATVLDAIRASGLLLNHPTLDLARVTIAVWGALRLPEDLLRDRDRVELCRPLSVDPMAARRRRHAAQADRPKAARSRR